MSATVDRIYCIHTLVLAVVDISSRHRLSPFSESLCRTVLIFSARPHDMYSTTSGSGSSNLVVVVVYLCFLSFVCGNGASVSAVSLK